MSSPKQRLLTISLYRNLLRWCRDAPDASLAHLSQRVGGRAVRTSDELRLLVKHEFRQEKEDYKQDIQRALGGLQLLYSLDIQKLPKIQPRDSLLSESTRHASSTFPWEWVEAVDWLPAIDETHNTPYQPSDLPLFPLSSPLLPNGDEENKPLPLFSPLMDMPVGGMETPLKIFEPRYREMYKDILADGSKKFVVPVAHPFHAGRFARYAWLFEIVRVEDIADQTQGQIHLVAHHLVTRPVRIETIVNPADWTTQSTYLRVRGQILEDSFAAADDLDTIGKTLRELMSHKEHRMLAERMLSGLGEGSIWPVASIWVNWLQMEALDMQVKVAAAIQLQVKERLIEKVEDSTIHFAQKPYRQDLESILLEVATLIPLLLQDSPKEQCERLNSRIRSRLQSKSK
jgi:Lon protease-like protein